MTKNKAIGWLGFSVYTLWFGVVVSVEVVIFFKSAIFLWGALFLELFSALVWIVKGDLERDVRSSELEKHEAEIRREARRVCLVEVGALIRGESIAGGVGSDVSRAYYLAKMMSEKRGKA